MHAGTVLPLSSLILEGNVSGSEDLQLMNKTKINVSLAARNVGWLIAQGEAL